MTPIKLGVVVVIVFLIGALWSEVKHLQPEKTPSGAATQKLEIKKPTNVASPTIGSPTVEPTPTPVPKVVTATVKPTQTVHTIPTLVPSPVLSRYVPIVGRIWSGVKVYYGDGAKKTYGFEILGGSDCPSMPGGRGGVKVRYPDGSEEWKDREYIVFSGHFFLLEDDPALSSPRWYEYYDCP